VQAGFAVTVSPPPISWTSPRTAVDQLQPMAPNYVSFLVRRQWWKSAGWHL